MSGGRSGVLHDPRLVARLRASARIAAVVTAVVGVLLAKKMRARSPDQRVLYMSGYAQSALTDRGTLDQGVELIEKPFSEPALLARVRGALDT